MNSLPKLTDWGLPTIMCLTLTMCLTVYVLLCFSYCKMYFPLFLVLHFFVSLELPWSIIRSYLTFLSLFSPSCQVWCWFVSRATLMATSTWWLTRTWRTTWREGPASTKSVTPPRGSSRGGNTLDAASTALPLNTRRIGPTGGSHMTQRPLISKIILLEEMVLELETF